MVLVVNGKVADDICLGKPKGGPIYGGAIDKDSPRTS